MPHGVALGKVARMKRISCLALLAFALLGSLSGSVARAGEWSIDDDLDCDEDLFITLFEDYETKCLREPRPDCANASGCFELRRIRQLLRECVAAADRVNNECFDGQSNPIRSKSMRAITAIQACNARMALPEPVGCGRICP